MEKETILKAAEYCANENVEHCGCCPLNEMSMNCGYYFAKYLADKELEPAPAGTETSPKENILHNNDITSKGICQAFNFADRTANTILDIYNAAMSESEQRAFDLGEAYRDMINAKCELEELKNIKEDKDE